MPAASCLSLMRHQHIRARRVQQIMENSERCKHKSAESALDLDMGPGAHRSHSPLSSGSSHDSFLLQPRPIVEERHPVFKRQTTPSRSPVKPDPPTLPAEESAAEENESDEASSDFRDWSRSHPVQQSSAEARVSPTSKTSYITPSPSQASQATTRTAEPRR